MTDPRATLEATIRAALTPEVRQSAADAALDAHDAVCRKYDHTEFAGSERERLEANAAYDKGWADSIAKSLLPVLDALDPPRETEDGDISDALLRQERDAIVRELQRRRLAPPRAASREGWQPIETAPHMLTVLVSWVNALGNRRTARATYYEAGTLPMSDDCDESAVNEEGNNAHAGWFEECESVDEIPPLDAAPTHWQPLPTPPQEP